ncbi:copper resistance D family protein [Rhodococcus sp. AW25M09]|uniref:copper resistance D family protein n=1 Tax=Rhodococcus sp. AW25M09 TaxID=1268303 RepID=UPI0009DB6728|nr:CopD family protein [Rhodococcus sp. AW25M09]
MGERSVRLVLAAAASASVGVAAAFALAYPTFPAGSSWLRVVAVASGSVVLGFGVLAVLDVTSESRRLAVDPLVMWRAIGFLSGLWAVAEFVLLAAAAADTAGRSPTTLSPSAFTTFATSISVGRLGAATVVLALVLCAIGVAGYRRNASWSPIPVIVLASIALVARPITGHMSQFAFGSIAVAVHVVCASVWFGVLGAMALSVRSKSAWATLLPIYSRVAFWCVVGVAVTGVLDAVLKLESVGATVETGYGRIVLAKLVVTVLLIAVAHRIRGTWLPTVSAHRSTVEHSVGRAAAHICLLAVAFGLAAALATTA